uniref:PX domain-containing protein n=1 Tax=Branchiostoma floridae TaxID=7739 RepID=C3Z2D5_BRAFL|eukprot:XP_002597174.1 hypothetical protein BRAFLDRAFT_203437 [Branchiostoma floridae]
MAGRKGKENDPWIRWFDVSDPQMHEKGYTIYKVTLKRIRSRSGPEPGPESVVVWRRYNDFKKLHKALSARYKHLARSEPFPAFAKSKIFGRFDEAVVEERRQSALELLEFVGKIPYLASSSILQTFFEVRHSVRFLCQKIVKWFT